MNAQQETQTELRIGRLLQWGVTIAALVVAAGGALYLYRYGHNTPQFRSFEVESEALRRPADILRGAFRFGARDTIQLGILLMIATPVLRVAYAVMAFARGRDWLYAGVSAVVLSLLGYALLGQH